MKTRNRPDPSITGFTLVELMIVVAIVGMLASIGMATYQNMTDRARVRGLEGNLIQAETYFKVFALSKEGPGPVFPNSGWITSQPGNVGYQPCNSWPDANVRDLCESLVVLPASTPLTNLCQGTGYVPGMYFITVDSTYKIQVHCAGAPRALFNSRFADPVRSISGSSWSISVSNDPAARSNW